MIAAAGRTRSGNPGVVPPYLARAAAPHTAPAGERAAHVTVLVPAELLSRLMRREQAVSQADRRAAVDAVYRAQSMFARLGAGTRDGNGGQLPVVFDPSYPNAAYAVTRSGQELLQIGSEPRSGRSFAQADDVIVHEYAHRVVEHMVGLEHGGEPGTVNESLADTFAAAIDRDDWTIGEDVVPGGVRSMDRPERGQDAIRLGRGRALPKPGDARDYLPLPREVDDGGVHINVGIPNKAAATIGKALGRDAMAEIYFGAMRDYLRRDSGIGDLAHATHQAAADLFGAGSRESAVVQQAWRSVGVRV